MVILKESGFNRPYSKIVIEDESGQVFHLNIENHVPVAKRGFPIPLGAVKEGDWVKILISQGIIGPGNVSQYVRELVVDGGSRDISNIYKGQITYIDPYQSNIHLKNTQPMQKDGWGAYTDIKPLSVNDMKNWQVKGLKDNTHTIDIEESAQIIKNGKLISPKSLEVGDKIKIFTPEENIKEAENTPGYIIIVE